MGSHKTYLFEKSYSVLIYYLYSNQNQMNRPFVVWGDTGTGAANTTILQQVLSQGRSAAPVLSQEAIENSAFPLKRYNMLKYFSDKGRTSKYWYIL